MSRKRYLLGYVREAGSQGLAYLLGLEEVGSAPGGKMSGGVYLVGYVSRPVENGVIG